MSSSRLGALGWLFQRITGLLLLLIVGAHFVWYYWVLGAHAHAGDLAYLLRRLFSDPLWKAVEGLFICLITYHAYLGLQAIILDLHPSHRLLRVSTHVSRGVCLGLVMLGLFFLYRI